MARTTDPCAGPRKRVKDCEQTIADLIEFLAESPTSQRPRIRRQIEQEKLKLRRLKQALRECEREHAVRKRPTPTAKKAGAGRSAQKKR